MCDESLMADAHTTPACVWSMNLFLAYTILMLRVRFARENVPQLNDTDNRVPGSTGVLHS